MLAAANLVQPELPESCRRLPEVSGKPIRLYHLYAFTPAHTGMLIYGRSGTSIYMGTRLLSNERTINEYNSRAQEFVARYEALKFEDQPGDLLEFIPGVPGLMLDVGCGSGRDAAWFAARGWAVVATDAASEMLRWAAALHPLPQISWELDCLPGLERVRRPGMTFDLVWLSAVWMHIQPDNREQAFNNLCGLLRQGGLLFMSLRNGPFTDARIAYPVSIKEIELLADRQGLAIRHTSKAADRFERTDVSWAWVCLSKPD
jgi:SAM-dependent methyltransferase